MTTPALDLESERRAWTHGYRGARTVWVEDSPEWIVQYIPTVKVGESVTWPVHELDRDLSSVLQAAESARVVGESDIYEECTSKRPAHGFRGTLVGVGVLYVPSGRDPTASPFIWRQFRTAYPDAVSDRSGGQYQARGSLCDFDDWSDLEVPPPKRWWEF